MDQLSRIELKIDCLLKCWSMKTNDSEKSLFDIVSELIKQHDIDNPKIKSIDELYLESKSKEDYNKKLKDICEKYFEQGKKISSDVDGYFIEDNRVFNIKDI